MLDHSVSVCEPLPLRDSKTGWGPDAQRNSTSSWGERTGRVRSRSVSVRLKTAATAPMPRLSEAMAAAVKTGDRRRSRAPYRRSCPSVSSQRKLHMSRVSSRITVTFPNSRRASYAASRGSMPSSIRLRVRRAMCASTSSRNSSSCRDRVRNADIRRRIGKRGISCSAARRLDLWRAPAAPATQRPAPRR